MNSKGNLGDIFLIGVIVLITALSFLLIGDIGVKFDQGLQSAVQNNSEAATAISKLNTLPLILDKVFIFIAVGLLLGLLALLYYLDVAPMFAAIFLIIGTILLAIIGAIFSNVYVSATETTSLSNTSTLLPLTSHFMNNLPLYLVIVAVIGVIVLYGKARSQPAI